MKSSKRQIITFDLDDVLCKRPSGFENKPIEKYHYAEPIQKMVDICNELYEHGYEIHIYTARGMASFDAIPSQVYNALFELTKNQLRAWGVKHHLLIMGKPFYNLFIDDKGMNSADVNSIEDIIERL